jgi:hypothetical protein
VGRVNTKKISVQWTAAEAEEVPVSFVNGLERLAVDRLVQFVRNNPKGARYSIKNDSRSGKPVMVL